MSRGVRMERRWAPTWDTVYFDRESMPACADSVLFDVVRAPHRMFMCEDDGTGRTNMEGNGCMPAGCTFELHEIGLRVDLDGEAVGDALHALLRSLKIDLSIGHQPCLTLPPGAFYPAGLVRGTCGSLNTSDVVEPNPEWLCGGYCRYVRLPGKAVTFPPFQNFHLLLTLVGVGHRTLMRLQSEGLLRGELAIVLNGFKLYDLL